MSPHSTETMDEPSSSFANGSTPNGHSYESVPEPAAAPVSAPLPEVVNGNVLSDARAFGHTPKGSLLKAAEADSVHDLICCGFGPASLAIAIALNDALEAGTLAEPPKVLFLEKQNKFAWHAGMLLPGATMQISFVKDLATLRDPRSNFTFLNYLHKNDRLVEFTNLSTFLPARAEYEDYLRWCSKHFDDVVRYQNEVVNVSPVPGEEGPQKIFTVTSRNAKTGETTTRKARNVILAIGGQPSIPKIIPAHSPRVIHSSQYETRVPQILTDLSAPVRVAVIGGGQSAAEIFNNIQTLYPNSKTYLIMKSEFLKPSDDSPFVNSIFNPEFVDALYPKSSSYRARLIADARATNYGVVRLELIEHLYEKLYHQRRVLGPDETKWPHRILGGRHILSVDESTKGEGLRVKVCLSLPGEEDAQVDGPLLGEETLDVDLLVCATGYRRTAHIDMIKDAWQYLPEPKHGAPIDRSVKDRWYVDAPKEESSGETETRIIEVGRDYAVRFQPGKVAPGSGIWLQGCCEGTHGLSDSLLSVLATRSGEMVESIFGKASSK